MDVVDDSPNSSFADKLCWVAKKLSKDKLRVFASLAWATWHCRNKQFFGDGERVDALGDCNWVYKDD